MLVINKRLNKYSTLPYLREICVKTPSGCLKPRIVSNPIYILCFSYACMHTYIHTYTQNKMKSSRVDPYMHFWGGGGQKNIYALLYKNGFLEKNQSFHVNTPLRVFQHHYNHGIISFKNNKNVPKYEFQQGH